MAMSEIVVVGASLGGLRAVEGLRRRGYDGRIVWIGAEAHLPYDRPPLSKQVIRGEWGGERTALKTNYDALGAELRLGRRAVSLSPRDRAVMLDDGSGVHYDGLVIATGASARNLPGTLPRGVHVLRTLDDALAIRAALQGSPRVAIVGAGFIGLEVAASCRALGLDVTVLDLADVPLAHAIGRRMGDDVVNMHRDRGVTLRTGVGVERVLGDDVVHGLALTDGTTVPADLVVVGIGVVPETAWLDGSGVVLEGGVVCDDRCRTNVPSVVACGDVVRAPNALFGEVMRVEHWSNAVDQAQIAVGALLDGDAAPPNAAVPYFWSDQYDLKFQFAGRVAESDELRIVQGSVAEKNLVAHYGRAGKLRGVLAVNQPGAFLRGRKALGEGAAF
jgi:3-phenylpropionate/trans-cinnamate dioxygenase ferredoxin reductase subunit